MRLLAAGLILKGRRGGHYDRFRNRVTFPIRDQRGRALGSAPGVEARFAAEYMKLAGGRAVPESHTLTGSTGPGPDREGAAGDRGGGYTDVLALHQAG